jgi:hypothetical protein
MVEFTHSVAQVPLSGHCGLLSSDTKCTAVVYIKTYWQLLHILFVYFLYCCVIYTCISCYFNSSVLAHLLHWCMIILHVSLLVRCDTNLWRLKLLCIVFIKCKLCLFFCRYVFNVPHFHAFLLFVLCYGFCIHVCYSVVCADCGVLHFISCRV